MAAYEKIDVTKPVMFEGNSTYSIEYVGKLPDGNLVFARDNTPIIRDEYGAAIHHGPRVVNRPERTELYKNMYRYSCEYATREMARKNQGSHIAGTVKLTYEGNKIVGVELVE